jgi:thiamine biosynthesis lipoprotein
VQELRAEVERLEALLSEYRESSEVAELQRKAVGEWMTLSSAHFQLFLLSSELSEKTLGAFDPSVKSSDGTCFRDRFEWEADGSRVRKRTPGAKLSYGAIGKGYALDRLREMLLRAGIEEAHLSAGGSSQVWIGQFEKPLGWSWAKDAAGLPLGWELHPTQEFQRALLLGGVAIGVSGVEERGAHIVGAPGSSVSSLVFTHSAAEADALSTALFVKGWDEGAPLVARALESRCRSLRALAAVSQNESTHSKGEVRWCNRFASVFSFAGRTLAASAVGAWASCYSHAWAAEPSQTKATEIDLGSLSEEVESSPYQVEREPLWVLLPLFMIGAVLLHLNRSKKARPS